MKVTPVIATLAIVILEVVAITQGINGATLGIAVAAVAGLGGWQAKNLRDKMKGGK